MSSTEDWYNELADVLFKLCDHDGCLVCPSYAKEAREHWKEEYRRAGLLFFAAQRLVQLNK